MALVRAAAVAGAFYPDDRDVLRADIDGFLQGAMEKHGPKKGDIAPKALVAPHAGYIYSGAVAASAYVKLLPLKDTIKRVVLLGPCHRVPVGGIALCSADYYETPLGRVPLDKDLSKRVSRLPQVFTFDDTHVEEHCLEVHLPFLQTILSDFTLLPLVVGQASAKEVAEVLETVWGSEETLIIISTDLSHFLDYNACQNLDDQTVKAIENMDINQIQNNQACGRIPLKGLLELARHQGMDITTLDVRNSGDTAGSKDRVVGYGSWMLSGGKQASEHEIFAAKMKALLDHYGPTLLQLGATSIKRGAAHNPPPNLDVKSFPESLQGLGATFVTIEKDGGNLRGCIGSLQAHQPLVKDISDNAYKAAFSDPRFPRVDEKELKDLSLHISVLSPSFEIDFEDQNDLLAQLRPEKDGLIIQDGAHRAVFLPSVWEKLPSKEQFLAHLKQKAGMSVDHWSGSFQAWRFITEGVHSENLDEPGKLWQDTSKT